MNSINGTTTKYILLTIDVEDWFQVENFKPWIPFETWDQRELRVERNVHRLLNLFDSCGVDRKPERLKSADQQQTTRNSQLTKHNNQPTNHNSQNTTNNKHTKKVRCTFFVLGWIAERLPNLVREIQARGHEVASHGYNHELPNLLSLKDLKKDLIDSKNHLEDITGGSIVGYRAPSFAINHDILKTIEDAGYRYDSSYNSFSLHGRYGKISLNGTGKKGIAHKISDSFFELPISNLSIKNPLSFQLLAFSSRQNKKKRIVLPWGGGGYFRLAPYRFFRCGVEQILKKDDAYVFYMHPWELDPEQPKIHQASFNLRFRHYSNLSKTLDRLKQLIKSFNNCAFITCKEYLTLIPGFGLQD